MPVSLCRLGRPCTLSPGEIALELVIAENAKAGNLREAVSTHLGVHFL